MRAAGMLLVKQETRNLTYRVQDFEVSKLQTALDASGYSKQQGCEWPDLDDGGYFVECPDPEQPEGGYVFACVCPDEDTGTYYLEFSGY